MRKSQVARSTRGTLPSCSTGHFSVSDCPGGNRPALRICCSSFFRSLLSPKSIAHPHRLMVSIHHVISSRMTAGEGRAAPTLFLVSARKHYFSVRHVLEGILFTPDDVMQSHFSVRLDVEAKFPNQGCSL